MTSLVDSVAHFRKRCEDLGMTDRGITSLTTQNMNTLGKLAFAVGQPGHPLVQEEFDRFTGNALGALANVADAAVLKRLVFEGHTMVLGQLRELVSNPDAASSRKLPAIEREHRLANLRGRLPGVVLERQLEPSHELLELMTQQAESNQLAYVGLERCSSREWEVTMGKGKKQLAIDAEKLTVKEKNDTPDQAFSTEMQAFEAMRRRGVAMVFADMVSWETHERYLQQLTSHLRADAPPGYSRTSLQQILKADRQVFLNLIRSGAQLRRLADGTLQLDVELIRTLESYEVGFHLLPLPRSASKTDSHQEASLPDRGNQNRQHRTSPYGGKGFKGSKGPKGKGKGRPFSILPKPLLGRDNVSTDPHNRRLCFDYSLGQCQNAPDGGQCDKGWHLCCRRNCHAPHPEKDHDKHAGKK